MYEPRIFIECVQKVGDQHLTVKTEINLEQFRSARLPGHIVAAEIGHLLASLDLQIKRLPRA